MDGKERRDAILARLKAEEKPFSASRFAKEFQVSRQIIVGDIALLRAAGYDITATARGYLLDAEVNKQGIIRKIACQHTPEQTKEELEIIIDLGGEVIDVVVEHPIYGELVGGLHIKNNTEIADFIYNYEKSRASLLSELTSGIHLHTIRCQNEEELLAIKKALAEKNILYKNE
ncbi:transcription repressor NadR [Enterococcus rivorum]|uniref:DNA-binding protein n=1 Tax=Enterococcus rivorum TaxID=762845 RepID=A0A1E5L0Z3_9ENTE|nr:transcription repressor NadR [Enterococcus rivorum]MBP2098684.1 transcriptional regulator of NAD metabolism [Enterococcus rivorum]OEH83777.1 DNA-binding protein [Enterococcus rivorum]